MHILGIKMLIGLLNNWIYKVKLSIEKSWRSVFNTFPWIIFINDVSLIACCALPGGLNPFRAVSINLIAASTF